jgi:hypothetical protein
MQAPCPETFHPADLFSRERRKQRMLQFLQAFERRSWSGAHEANFLVPVSRADLREAATAARTSAGR